MKVIPSNPEELRAQIRARFIEAANILAEEMRKKAIQMDLVSKGGSQGLHYAQGFIVGHDDDSVWIENATPHAKYLEYGTYKYFELYGLEGFPESPDPKKKNLDAETRLTFPRGMQPFATMRRVLYNDSVVKNVFRRVFA